MQKTTVRTYSELMREPPHKQVLSNMIGTCHGNWPCYAV